MGKNKEAEVIIEVNGGVAEVTKKTKGVRLVIMDYDAQCECGDDDFDYDDFDYDEDEGCVTTTYDEDETVDFYGG